MRSIAAVLAALAVFLVSWILVATSLALIGFLATKATQGDGLLHYLHIGLIWVVSPGAAAFVAIHTTPRIYRAVPFSTIYVSFVTIAAVLATATLSIGGFMVYFAKSSVTEFFVALMQFAAVFAGARIGRVTTETMLPIKTASLSNARD